MPVHGISKNADLDPELLHREVRPFRYRVKDFFSTVGGAVTAFLGCATIITPWIGYASLSDFMVAFGLIMLLLSRNNRRAYPLRRPMDPLELDPTAKLKKEDKGDPKKILKRRMGNGIILIGNDRVSNEAFWVSNDDARTHMLVFGSTGSGKTRFLLGLFYQALLLGSGVMYVDGKGDTTVFGLVFSMVRRLGREDDLLLINYLTGSKTPGAKNDGSRLSNTTNPFAYGPAEQLRSLVVSLMRDGGGDDMWKGRASALLAALLQTLVYLRDVGEINMDVGKLRDFMPLDRVLELTQRRDIPEHGITLLKKYLLDLPGYNDDDALNGSLSPKCYEQHGYLQMQLTEVLSELSSTYAHIFNAPLGEVDYKDLVYNRRILFVMLPALEKDPDSLSGLGKLVVAGVRSALAPALGEKVEGSHEEVMDAKPTNSDVPFLLILDEYGYYSVKGFSVVAAQARSLGISVIFAGQDFPSFKRGGEDEAKSVTANTNIKIFMKLEDQGDTFQLAVERAGEGETAGTAGHEVKGDLVSGYADNLQTRIERRKRITIRDLVDQKPGEAHVMFGDLLVRCSLFYAEPKPSPEYRINRMLMVNRPSAATIKQITQARSNMSKVFDSGLPLSKLKNTELDAGLKALFTGYELARNRNQEPNSSARLAFGLMEYQEQLLDETFVRAILGDNAPQAAKAAPGERTSAPGDGSRQPAPGLPAAHSPRPAPRSASTGDQDDELDNEVEAGLAFMREPYESDSAIKQEAKDIYKSLSEIINDTIQEQIDTHEEAISPRAQQEALPLQQLKAIEMEHGLDEEEAEAEARRGLEIIDERIQYPSEPQPNRLSEEIVSKTLEMMLKQIDKNKDS
jgi:intracellular multiplication protein IcmO